MIYYLGWTYFIYLSQYIFFYNIKKIRKHTNFYFPADEALKDSWQVWRTCSTRYSKPSQSEWEANEPGFGRLENCKSGQEAEEKQFKYVMLDGTGFNIVCCENKQNLYRKTFKFYRKGYQVWVPYHFYPSSNPHTVFFRKIFRDNINNQNIFV